VKEFGTLTSELLTLSDWLAEEGLTHVAMASTGEYWRPIYNLLEGTVTVFLVNATHEKLVPGRKTDQADARWLAKLTRNDSPGRPPGQETSHHGHRPLDRRACVP
jgi:transposase